LATSLGFAPNTPQHAECQEVVAKLYEVFIKKECTLLEINPLVETKAGKVMVCDAKLGFDDNAFFRQSK
jgi:succinyl-CoA synthetase beta subunit